MRRRQPDPHHRGQCGARQRHAGACRRDRRLACALAHASGLRRRAGGARHGRARAPRRHGAAARGRARLRRRLPADACRSIAYRFREDGHSTHSFGPTFGAAAAAGALAGLEAGAGAPSALLYRAAGVGHLMLDARSGARRESFRLRRHAGAQRRRPRRRWWRTASPASTTCSRASAASSSPTDASGDPGDAGARARRDATRSCAPTSSAGRSARRSRRRSTRSPI